MIIEKKYHFYAAHRNQDLDDKCCNIHGHTYYVIASFDLEKKSSITMLFSDIDRIVDPIIKSYDHGFIIDKNDPLWGYLLIFPHQDFKFKVFPYPTSVEHLCEQLFAEILLTGLNIVKISVQETTSSTITYTRKDYDEYFVKRTDN